MEQGQGEQPAIPRLQRYGLLGADGTGQMGIQSMGDYLGFAATTRGEQQIVEPFTLQPQFALAS